MNGGATRKENDKKAEIFAQKMRRSLGDKRNELSKAHIDELVSLANGFQAGKFVKSFDTTDFGYRRIQVERPLRLNFQTTEERIARLEGQSAFAGLALSKKRGEAGAEEVALGRELQEQIRVCLQSMDSSVLYKDREKFEQALNIALKTASLKIASTVRKAILSALGERDETAEICRLANGEPEADPELRDNENVPLKEDIRDYFKREVLPHVPDAWINEIVRDEKDGKIGKVGYELNFNRYFYEFEPPRSLEAIDADIKALEQEILDLLAEVTHA